MDSSAVFESGIQYRWAGAKSKPILRLMAHLVLMLVVLLLALQAWQLWQLQTQLDVVNRERNVGGAGEPGIDVAKPGASRVFGHNGSLPSRNLSQEQRRSLNQTIGQLNTPWHGLFAQLEEATPRSVALLSIEPDGKRMVRIQAEAKTLDNLLLYAASLQNRGVFGELVYVKHETNEQDSTRPARLSFQLALKTVEVTLASRPLSPSESKVSK